MILRFIVEGGNMKPSPAISQKLGPLGMNMGKIIKDVNSATKDFVGIKVPVVLDINTKTKDTKVTVQTPPTSELIKRELKIEKGTASSKKVKVGNISFEHIIKIAKTKQNLEKGLLSAIKSVLGSCSSMGILVENKEPSALLKEVEAGVYDSLIKEEKTEPSAEKVFELQKYFENIKQTQEVLIKKEEEEKAKAKEEAATPAPAEKKEEEEKKKE